MYDCYNQYPTIPLSQWSEIFGNKKLTNALLDRLVHHSKLIQITGPSYRMKSYSENKEVKS
ncbi:TPA: ATP-binding protein [Listeria monocytogenes]